MARAVTAIYRTFAVADLVRDELVNSGLAAHHVTVIPDRDEPVTPGETRMDTGAHFDRLHDLHLPEDDSRTYQQAIRNGDYVVSVAVDDDAHLERVRDIMRRPEDAHNLDELHSRYGTAEYSDRREPLPADYDEGYVGRRDSATDPYLRTYTRGRPLPSRGTRP